LIDIFLHLWNWNFGIGLVFFQKNISETLDVWMANSDPDYCITLGDSNLLIQIFGLLDWSRHEGMTNSWRGVVRSLIKEDSFEDDLSILYLDLLRFAIILFTLESVAEFFFEDHFMIVYLEIS